MRWADLDELSHVNNVTYLDYAHEARAVHVAAGELADRAVEAVSVEFLRPLLLSRTPLHVTSADDGTRLVQEIRPATSTSAFARVTWAEHADDGPAAGASAGAGDPYEVRVRRSDLGAGDVSSTTAVFEYAQEARIATVGRIARIVVVTHQPATHIIMHQNPQMPSTIKSISKSCKNSFLPQAYFTGVAVLVFFLPLLLFVFLYR